MCRGVGGNMSMETQSEDNSALQYMQKGHWHGREGTLDMIPTLQQYATDCCHSCYELSTRSKVCVCACVRVCVCACVRVLHSPPTCTCWGSAPSGSAVRSRLAARPSRSRSCPLVKTHPRTGCHPSWKWGPPRPPRPGRKVLCGEGGTEIDVAEWGARQSEAGRGSMKLIKWAWRWGIRRGRCEENKIKNQIKARVAKEVKRELIYGQWGPRSPPVGAS